MCDVRCAGCEWQPAHDTDRNVCATEKLTEPTRRHPPFNPPRKRGGGEWKAVRLLLNHASQTGLSQSSDQQAELLALPEMRVAADWGVGEW